MKQEVLNLHLLMFFICLQTFQLFVLPAWLLPQNAYWGFLLLIPAVLTTSWWALIHEAIHGCMFSHKLSNRVSGRLLAILFGSPFDLLRWGHLLHHAYSRTERERPEVYMPHQGPVFWVKLNYYFRLLGGLYLFEVMGGLLLLLPQPILKRLVNKLSNSDNVVELLWQKIMPVLTVARIDAVLILLAYGLAFSVYGAHAWMLLGALFLRGGLISLVDNLFHYDTPLDQTRYAHNLYLPAWLSRLVLHFNLHGVHHLYPHVSCWQLPQLHAASGQLYQGKWMRSMRAQFKGAIPWHAFQR